MKKEQGKTAASIYQGRLKSGLSAFRRFDVLTFSPRFLTFTFSSCLVLFVFSGCCLQKVPSPRSLDNVIREHNARVASVPMLYCPRLKIAGYIRPPGKIIGHGYDLEASLVYLPPRKMRLVGNVAGVEVLGLGSNGERYWLFVKAQINAMWWGYWANVDHPNVQPTPLRPDELTDALSLMPINPRRAGEEISLETRCEEEVVTFWRYDPTERKLLWILPLPKPDPRGTPVRVRQYVFDRMSRDLTGVRHFDEQGQFVLREARLLGYQPVEPPPAPTSRPSDPDLEWMGIKSAPQPTTQPAPDQPLVRMPSLVKIIVHNDGHGGAEWFDLELGRVRFDNPNVSPKAFEFPHPLPVPEVIWVDGLCR